MDGQPPATVLCPFELRVDRMASFLNAELADHPVYDGVELQRFDDDRHGTGMLAFLKRRADRRVDYYVEPGLRLDRSSYEIGGGIGAWEETIFEVARLHVDGRGVDAEVRFTDREGRRIEVRVDDRAAGPRHPGRLLAPIGAGIDQPVSLLLVQLHGFELVRQVEPAPIIAIDGIPASTGQLPGRWLHRRHLVKYAGPVTVGSVCPVADGALVARDVSSDGLRLDGAGRIVEVHAADGDATGRLVLDPPLPALHELPDAQVAVGRWLVGLDGSQLTGGTWSAERTGDEVALGLDVTRGWQPPPGQPLLLRVVTRLAPVFRRWPTTYRWRAVVTLGDPPTITSRWERTGRAGDAGYRRATGS